jgi:trigger factor
MAKYSIKYLPKSVVEVVLNITKEEIGDSYNKALNKITGETELKGFRKGKAPKEMVETTVGREKIYEEALNKLLPKKLEDSLKEESEKNKDQKFIILDYPKFDLKKEWQPGEELEVTATFSLYPKVDIEKLDTLKMKKEQPKEVTDNEVEESVNKIFEQYKKIKETEKKKKEENILAKKEDQDTALVDTQGNSLIQKEEDAKKDDTFAQAAGAQNLEDLKSMVKSELQYHSQMNVENKFEEELVTKMADLVEVDIPDILVQDEMNRIEQRFRSQLARIGTTIEGYLASDNKTKEDLLKEWEVKARENAKIALILNEVKLKNDIPVSDAEIASLAQQNDIKPDMSQEQYTTLKYLIGQTKALNHIKTKVQE